MIQNNLYKMHQKSRVTFWNVSLVIMQCITQKYWFTSCAWCVKLSSLIQNSRWQPCGSKDEVAEWLRRWTANPMCSARVGSNPILVGINFYFWRVCIAFFPAFTDFNVSNVCFVPLKQNKKVKSFCRAVSGLNICAFVLISLVIVASKLWNWYWQMAPRLKES